MISFVNCYFELSSKRHNIIRDRVQFSHFQLRDCLISEYRFNTIFLPELSTQLLMSHLDISGNVYNNAGDWTPIKNVFGDYFKGLKEIKVENTNLTADSGVSEWIFTNRTLKKVSLNNCQFLLNVRSKNFIVDSSISELNLSSSSGREISQDTLELVHLLPRLSILHMSAEPYSSPFYDVAMERFKFIRHIS